MKFECFEGTYALVYMYNFIFQCLLVKLLGYHYVSVNRSLRQWIVLCENR